MVYIGKQAKRDIFNRGQTPMKMLQRIHNSQEMKQGNKTKTSLEKELITNKYRREMIKVVQIYRQNQI